jgi:hypothetical protein
MKAIRALFSALVLVVAAASGAEPDESQRSYGYVRTLEGSASIVSADTGTLDELILNHPVLTGDRVIVAPEARLELVLSDFNIVRLGGDTEVELGRLSYSADTDARSTSLTVLGGDLQIVVSEYALGDELPVLVLPNSTVYLHEPGSYRVRAEGDLTVVVVRSGYAEVSTERGSAIARTDEEIRVEGARWPSVAVLQAGPSDELEVWGDLLLAEADEPVHESIDPALRYSAGALEGNGEWVEVDGGSAWSPYVEESWRPYTRGTWVPTPAGVSWVGYESWGWITGHYGYWGMHPARGWLWYPGAAWAPAWVHWYWGPSFVGWVAWGFYDGFYGGHLGLGLGFYGWAGGYSHHYSHWTFCPTYYFGRGPGHYYKGSDLPKRTGRTAVPRGVITTDTRGITKDNWRDGVAAGEALATRARGAGRSRPAVDVTSFVSRSPELSDDVRNAVGGGVSTTRTVARRGSGGADTVRSAIIERAGQSSLGSPAPVRGTSRLASADGQAWRERGSGRRIYTVDRGAHERSRQADVDAVGRSVRSMSFDRPAGHGRTRSYSGVDNTRWSSGRADAGRVGERRSSPARRVVDRVTSSTRRKAWSSSRSGSRQRPSSASAGSSSRRSSASAGPRSGGSRPSSVRSSGGGGRSSSMGSRSSGSSGASRSRPSGGSASKPKSGGGGKPRGG